MGNRIIEMQERGYGETPDKSICVDCVTLYSDGNYALIDLVVDNKTKSTCSYCGTQDEVPIAADVEIIIERVAYALGRHYGTAENELPRDNESDTGWYGTTYSTDEILSYHLRDGNPLFDDLVSTINDETWCDLDNFALSEDRMYMYSWEIFVELVKHKKRYMFSSHHSKSADLNEDFHLEPMEILKAIGDFIVKFDLYKKIGPEENMFHIRFGDHYTQMSELVAPPKEFANQPNRMNPPGISMFYAAYDERVAILETVSSEDIDKKYTVGKFSLKENSYLIDLSKAAKLVSIFDFDNAEYYYMTKFMNNYVREISRPAKKEMGYANIDYVPTQILTEYLRYGIEHPKPITGFQFRSSKSDKENEYVSLAMFLDHDECLRSLTLDSYEHRTYRRLPDASSI